MGRRGWAVIVVILLSISSWGNDWGMSWIKCQEASSYEQVWFRKTLILEDKPSMARICMASQGNSILYVNGYNVCNDVLSPYGNDRDSAMITRDIEVTQYLRPDSNIIAVWYSPRQDIRSNDKQLSLKLYGYYGPHALFSFPTDEGWSCRSACATTRTQEGGIQETFDRTGFISDWNVSDTTILGWNHAYMPRTSPSRHAVRQLFDYESLRVQRIITGQLDISHPDHPVCRFDHGFKGWIRLTLRGMQKGDTLRIGNYEYVCSGDMDEQACQRFSLYESADGVVNIGCSRQLTPENVTQIEALEIGPYWHHSYRY